jgi:hypothetical protein
MSTATAALAFLVRADDFAPDAPYFALAIAPGVLGSFDYPGDAGYGRAATELEARAQAAAVLARNLERELDGLYCGYGNYSATYRAVIDRRRVELRGALLAARELAA